MQYPPLRWGGSGKFQLALSGCGLPLILSVLGATKLFSLPWNSVDCVSKQTSPVPRFPELKWLLLATLKRTGLLQRPEQGLACCGWHYVRHVTAFGFEFPWQNCASCPHAVIGSDAHNDGLVFGVCPACAWNTERATNRFPPKVTRSFSAYLICGC